MIYVKSARSGRVRIAALAVVGVLVGMVSGSAMAGIPPIESAPSHVEGYIQCLDSALLKNSWGSTTVFSCRNSYPAVNALNQGDYVAVTFDAVQEKLYRDARGVWVEYDKLLVRKIFSSVIPDQFNSAGVRTAYSFNYVVNELESRYSEMMDAPFSWYDREGLELKTSAGQTLRELHESELHIYSSCLVIDRDKNILNREIFNKKATTCLREITQKNHDGSLGVYKKTAFENIANEYWGVMQLKFKNSALELARQKEKIDRDSSWFVKLKRVVVSGLIIFFIGVGVRAIWLCLRRYEHTHNPAALSRAYRSRVGDDDNHNRNLGNFTLGHLKIGSAMTQHRCASCVYWAGARVPHPASRELYVKEGASGMCSHKHPGSPYGIKRYNDGQYCKDFSRI